MDSFLKSASTNTKKELIGAHQHPNSDATGSSLPDATTVISAGLSSQSKPVISYKTAVVTLVSFYFT